MTIGDSLGPDGRRLGLYGVRGWLLFLCIILMVLLPFQMVLIAIAALTANEPSVFGLGFLAFMFAFSGFGVVTGVLLYRENPLGVRLAKIWFAFRILLIFVAVLLLSPAPSDPPARMQGGLLSAAIPGAWLIYLFRSERVRNTYSRSRIEELSEAFR